MLRSLLVLAALTGGLGGCSKESKKAPAKAPAAAVTTGTVGTDGVRTVAIEAGKEGFVPDTINGKPGEKLILSFTRTVDGDCLAELKAPDGTTVALPKGEPVKVPVTVPQTGEVSFACGMDMFHGKIVAAK